ncbi:hypothetical protein BJV77DRAFT_65766 [Russula vinacea]|nr:hypothetical protein BJV77DRAFT_65766 [Russula vinacea]
MEGCLDRRHFRGIRHDDRGWRHQSSLLLLFYLSFLGILSCPPSPPSSFCLCIIEEYSMFIPFFSTALLILFSSPIVRAGFSVQTPNLTQCVPVNLSWDNTQGPYDILIANQSNQCGYAVADPGNLRTICHVDRVTSAAAMSAAYLPTSLRSLTPTPSHRAHRPQRPL